MAGARRWGKRISALAQRRPASLAPRVERRVGADGSVSFLKRFDMEPPSPAMRLHVRLSRHLPPGPWSASPLLEGAALADREQRKRRAFEAAGQPVPRVLHEDRTSVETADCGPSLEMRLRAHAKAGEREAHEALLVRAARALGLLHRAGLCHGRPHPRDMALRGEEVVWFDLEEEPEAAMPLVDAQARDLWLLFLQICGRALDGATPALALNSYRAAAGTTSLRALRRPMRILRPLLPPLRMAARVHAGSDLRRLLLACAFLGTALAASSETI